MPMTHRLLLLSFLLSGCSGDAGKPDGSTIDDPTVDPTGPPTTDDPPTPPEACPVVVAFDTSPGVQPLEQRFTVTLDGPAAVWATCAADATPEELHLVESTASADTHELVLRGLLGATDYTCEVRPTCGGDPASTSFTSGTPSGPPQFVVESDPSAQLDGAYTLFNSQEGCFGGDQWALIVDPDGKVRWMYKIEAGYVSDIDLYLVDSEHLHIGGGWGLLDEGEPNRGVFRTIDLSGQVQVERSEPDFGIGFNHHSEPLDDGTYLSLTAHTDSLGTHEWHGVGIEVWSPTDGVVWSWDSQALVDGGYIPEPSAFAGDLPYHANAVAMVQDAHGDAVWVSNFGMEELWRLDRATGELTDVFGDGGDFALVDPAGDPLPDGDFPSVQHGPDYQDDRVLVYDNGQDDNQTRVVEYQLDLDAHVAVQLWEWTEPGWYHPILGDADYLPGGNVLVTQGNSCFTLFGPESSIVELAPPATEVWRMWWPGNNFSSYRAERYDGCEVFGNARYCPAIADRIAELSAR
ncbi:MAG: aryl-sulfate sulfotransferase [Myxococcota bacterium]